MNLGCSCPTNSDRSSRAKVPHGKKKYFAAQHQQQESGEQKEEEKWGMGQKVDSLFSSTQPLSFGASQVPPLAFSTSHTPC